MIHPSIVEACCSVLSSCRAPESWMHIFTQRCWFFSFIMKDFLPLLYAGKSVTMLGSFSFLPSLSFRFAPNQLKEHANEKVLWFTASERKETCSYHSSQLLRTPYRKAQNWAFSGRATENPENLETKPNTVRTRTIWSLVWMPRARHWGLCFPVGKKTVARKKSFSKWQTVKADLYWWGGFVAEESGIFSAVQAWTIFWHSWKAIHLKSNGRGPITSLLQSWVPWAFCL